MGSESLSDTFIQVLGMHWGHEYLHTIISHVDGAHIGLLVGTWVHHISHGPIWPHMYPLQLQFARIYKTMSWTCKLAYFVCQFIILLLFKAGLQDGMLTWGNNSWLIRKYGLHILFLGNHIKQVFLLTPSHYFQGYLDMLPSMGEQEVGCIITLCIF